MSIYKRIETDIHNYIGNSVEITPGVFFSQYKTINRIYKFRNKDLTGTKINPDLSYDYYFDIISPRADSEVKNLRFDTKHIMVFSQNPQKDFPVVFLSNASLKSWMAENGEDEKLKDAVEEFTNNGNVGFKKSAEGYEIVDPRNTIITNITAKTIDETDIIERHNMTASDIVAMEAWDKNKKMEVIRDLGGKTFTTNLLTTSVESTNNKYEIFEFTGEVSEKEYNECKGIKGGDENKYLLAKIIFAGLQSNGKGKRITLFAEKLKGKISDHYIYAHRGSYTGRFWRVGMYELLMDHQIRANEIGNQLARGLEWASKVIFRSRDTKVLQNMRADLDNGDIIITEDLSQVNVRLQSVDQLIADWNRLLNDADRLSNSMEVTRGEALPSGTPFRMGLLMDQNAGKYFALIRQKITLPYKRVFREWVLPYLIKDMKAKDIFRLVGDTEIQDQLREIMAENWYMSNLIKIGPHTKELAIQIKAEKLEELKKVDPVIQNTKEIWENVLPRLFVTITGEAYHLDDQLQDIIQLLQLEPDPVRRSWMLDQIYRIRNIPIPPQVQQAMQPTQPTAEQPAPQEVANAGPVMGEQQL